VVLAMIIEEVLSIVGFYKLFPTMVCLPGIERQSTPATQ
jgi:hypothetical protein